MWLLTLLKTGFGAVLKVLKWGLGMAGKTTHLPKWVYYVLHYGVVLVVTVVLGYFTEELLGTASLPDVPYVIRQFWAGHLFLLAYLFLRLLVYFLSVLWEEDESEFGDIDRAFSAGMAGLARGGLDLRRLPLFIVQGLEEVTESQFIQSGGFVPTVIAPPPEVSSPLRFYANHDALFIVCSGVSGISKQLQIPAEPRGSRSRDVQQTRAARDMPAPGIPVGQETRPVGALLGNLLKAASGQPSGRMSIEPLGVAEIQESERRIRYLSGLLTQARNPLCPVNGLLFVVPLEWSTAPDKQGLSRVIRSDVYTFHAGVQQLFPVACLFNGLQELGDVSEFVERARAADLSKGIQPGQAFNPAMRAGTRFPPGHRVDGEAAEWIADKSLEWFRGWCYSAFAQDLAAPSNMQLYRFLCGLEKSRPGLINLLQSALADRVFDGQERVRLIGCYYCACDPRRRKGAFVEGVLRRIVSEQELVAYPPARAKRDHEARNWGYVVAAANVLLLGANLWLLFRW